MEQDFTLKIEIANTNKQKRDFINFIYTVYKDVPNYRDNLNFSAKNFIYKKDTFAKNCITKPILIYNENNIVARCMYIYNKKLPILQIGFFESLKNNDEAVKMMLEEAKRYAKELGIDKIIIGLNGHLTYGVGFLKDNYKKSNSFDGIYTQDYYIDYFKKFNFIEHTLTTYYMMVNSFVYDEKLLNRIYKNFSFRTINLKNLKEEMNILGDLFNKTLGDTRYYFHKEIQESYEIIKAMVPLLKNENIVYAMKDNKEIGFLFWHPNYNQVLTQNRKNTDVSFLIKYNLNKSKVKEMKVNAFGILPEYSGSGAIIGLFNEVYKIVKNRYIGGESSFVWDDNKKSTLINRRVNEKECKHYVVFECNF